MCSDPSLAILTPSPDIYGYYAGRTGKRYHSPSPNWLDDGAYTLGVASYAIVSAPHALVFDAHISPIHASAVLSHLRSLGVTQIIASEETKRRIKDGLESFLSGDPSFEGVLPTRTFNGILPLSVGALDVELCSFNIHTSDSIVVWIPSVKLLLAGDTLEDTCTFMAEPENGAVHLRELERMERDFPSARILPAHGSAERINEKGYDMQFVAATRRYIAAMTKVGEREPKAWNESLREVQCVQKDLQREAVEYWGEYEMVHKENVQALRSLTGS
ncbi:beta-lactamase domain-containing protein [Pseudovirgaria hyperparasitica]|uniref:Beta-lactamase domain-containing protein n=1 Tax=Pseudovirgaria hyperparasitica TaxID=470096 RepID=A0A6A6W6H3_9PEZI|nr:beta-lactamase domain-containing protein [Pseudovirgaria hyperparasitica]KAF2758472.1 beta-lactamase domain-containing protein [Pseudovirgaria hyperparasitica]